LRRYAPCPQHPLRSPIPACTHHLAHGTTTSRAVREARFAGVGAPQPPLWSGCKGAHSSCKGAGRLSYCPATPPAGRVALLPGLFLPSRFWRGDTAWTSECVDDAWLEMFPRPCKATFGPQLHTACGVWHQLPFIHTPHHGNASISTSPLQAGVPLCGFLPVEHGHSLDSFQLYAWTTTGRFLCGQDGASGGVSGM
jgi:hypothetical protein